MKKFTSFSYQKQKTFAGFLPGISGTLGIPMWSFYVNRGQAIASFGVRDKNGAIMEFYPANQSYAYVGINGFRTFIKVNGKFYECFKESNDHQTLDVEAHQITISEELKDAGVQVTITYFTLPEASVSALVRRVTFKNLDAQPKKIEVLDGLNQMLPSGIDHGGYKAVSNLLQSWMQVDSFDRGIFLKLRASTTDSSEVSDIQDGNFYFYEGLSDIHYVYDYKLIYRRDTSFRTPYGFIEKDAGELRSTTQAAVNQVPSAFAHGTFTLTDKLSFYGVFGYGKDKTIIETFRKTVNLEMLDHKFKHNQQIISNLVANVHTETSQDMFDAYVEQCFLDNVLRGGFPLMFDTKLGPVAYHVYSRKHGDLERDYNFFSLEPTYFSQGNGAFRDVLQNRRNDIYIQPKMGDFSIRQFGSFIQADGYNPLSIEGLSFTFEGEASSFHKEYHSLLAKDFSPGEIATLADRLGDDPIAMVQAVLKDSTYEFKATYGEGYWEDHFTYHYDQIQAYLDVYPDKLHHVMFETKLPYFVSPARVRPRADKYVLKNGKVRQHYAAFHDHHAPVRGWLKDEKQQRIEHPLFTKLLTLVVNKFAHLDPDAMGLMYEGERPGWNDAMNGLPGLFGSGVSELFELTRLVSLLTTIPLPDQVPTLLPLLDLMNALTHIKDLNGMDAWNQRMSALEVYRDKLTHSLQTTTVSKSVIEEVLRHLQQQLTKAVERIKTSEDIIPTYFMYEATAYEPLTHTVDHGQPTVKVTEFKRMALPHFLEGPTRYLSSLNKDVTYGRQLVQAIRSSGIFDAPLGLYKTSESLENMSMELGRIRAFTPGWLERESDFLHMSYKFFLGLFKSELYDEFYRDIAKGMTCFMDPEVYGRSPLENSSFIATSNNPDPSKHGQGFFARLSGSTAEVLSLWKLMFFGSSLFSMVDDELQFSIQPKIPASYFKNGRVSTTLFGSVEVVLHYEGTLPTYDASVVVNHYELKHDHHVVSLPNSMIKGKEAEAIRALRYQSIHVFLKGGREPG